MKKKLFLLILVVVIALAILTACGEEDNEDCVASFSLGEATGEAPANIVVGKGESFTLPAPDVVFEGHTFKGWLADSDGALHLAGDEFTINGDVNFIAIWSGTASSTTYFDILYSFDQTRGSVSLSSPSAGSTKYASGSQATLTVIPASDYFVGSVLFGDEPVKFEGEEYTFTVDRDMLIRVDFREKLSVALNFDDALGNVSVSAPADGGTRYAGGERVTLSVSAIEGAAIVDEVSVNGEEVELENGRYSFEIERNTTINAAFLKLFALTTSFEQDKGDVEVTPATHGGKYAEGDAITVVATASEGFALKALKVNGEKVAHSRGSYTFNISQNTTIDAEFSLPISQSALESLQGSLRLEGVMTNHDLIGDDSVTQDNLCVFDETQQAIWLREIFEGELYFNAVYVNKDGLISQVTHTAQGKLEYYDSDNPFDEFDNPFKELTANDFAYDDDEIIVPDLALAKQIAVAITGYFENVEKLSLVEEGGKIAALRIVIAPVVAGGEAILQYTYDYAVSEHGTASVPAEWLQDYVSTSAHTALNSALAKARTAKSYTIKVHSEEQGYDTLDYNIFVTPDAIYEDNPGWESGYVKRDDGYVWEFIYDPNIDSATFTDSTTNTSVKSMAAPFRPNASLDLLAFDGVDTYYVREIDQVVGEDTLTGYEGAFATAFAVGRARQMTFRYAYDFKLTLKNGLIYKVDFTYMAFGANEHLTMTFEDFNNTTIPIEIVDRGRWAGYIGKYSGTDKSGAKYDVEITESAVAITVDGAAQTVGIVDFDEDGGFTVKVNDETYYLFGLGPAPYAQLTYQNVDGNFNMILVNEKSSEVDPPPSDTKWDKYIGVFESGDGKYHIEITADSVTVTVDGNETTATNIIFDNIDDCLTFMLDGVEYTLQNMSYDDPVSKIMFYPSEDMAQYVTLSRKE